MEAWSMARGLSSLSPLSSSWASDGRPPERWACSQGADAAGKRSLGEGCTHEPDQASPHSVPGPSRCPRPQSSPARSISQSLEVSADSVPGLHIVNSSNMCPAMALSADAEGGWSCCTFGSLLTSYHCNSVAASGPYSIYCAVRGAVERRG